MDINKLTLDEKIGQMLCLAFHGTEYNDQLKFLVEENHIGNIIHFARNILNREQVTRLNKDINKHANLPVFIALDQEGGMVRRIVDEMTYIPGAMALSAGGIDKIYEINYHAGLDLKLMGFNVNYAPVGDINNNPLNPVINSRSYSDNPEVVSNCVISAFKGFQDALVLPTVKHFPGHGDTNVDSHLGLPVVKKTIEEMNEMELMPFIKAINEGLDGVMVSHILYDKIDDIYPSSISKKVINDLLIEKLNFKGLVTTDSLTMAAIWGKYEIEDIVLNGINAGNDVLVFCGKSDIEEQTKIINAFKKLVNEGKISIERINKSVKKVLELKKKYCQEIKEYNGFDNALSYDVTDKSITKVLDNGLLPINEQDKVLVLFPKITLASLVDNEDNSYETLSKYLKSKEVIISDETTNIEDIAKMSQEFEKIILCTYNLKENDVQKKLFNLLNKDKVIVVALRSPFDIMHLNGVNNYICTYDLTKQSLKSLSKKLRGNSFEGILPVKL